jgi:CBS domain-containing protein
MPADSSQTRDDDPRRVIPPELQTVVDFLEQTLPFNELDADTLRRVAGALQVSYHRRGEQLGASDGGGLRILRSGAVDLRDEHNKLLDRLGEGESFHIERLNAPGGGAVIATVIEDSLVYLLPDAAYRQLRETHRHIDRYFSSQRSRRLRRAARYEPEPHVMTRPVASVMCRELLTVTPRSTVRDTAVLMSERRVSSVFVMDGDELLGILTDRDLRARVVAEGLDVDTPVGQVMTADPLWIDAGASLFEATLSMTRHHCHHLPVKAEGRLAGIVTTSDLMLARQDDPVYLVQHISRQEEVSGIAELLQGVPNLMVQWVNTGIRAQQVSRVLTAISDAVTVRLIQLAETRLGAPPVPYCWTGFGSQGRQEQLLGADQDNGLILDDRVSPGDAPYYEQLARFVCDGLNSCGYPYCKGEVMAVTPQWRQSLAGWREVVRSWTRTPTPDAVMRVSIFFDLRSIYGEAALCRQLQETMLELSSRNTIFLAALAANALDSTPPLGIFRRFVVDRDGQHRDSLDLKKRGVLPITDIARLHALAAGVEAVNTEERLVALAKSGQLAMVDSRNLIDALHCLQRQRLQNHVDQQLHGEALSNFINPRRLPKMAREQLRDAFSIIHDAQSAVRLRYRQGMG